MLVIINFFLCTRSGVRGDILDDSPQLCDLNYSFLPKMLYIKFGLLKLNISNNTIAH